MINKIKIIGCLILLIAGEVAYGQVAFNYKEDYKKVLAKTKDPNDSLSYARLLKQFVVNYNTMTDYEILALLIGFSDNSEFKPYSDLDIEAGIYELNEKEKFKEALSEANTFLKTHPLNVKVIFEKAYSFHKLNKEDSAGFYSYMGRRIFRAMSFSGNGKTPETPIFSLGPADGQDYVKKFLGAKIGTMGSGSDKNGNFLDILEVFPRDGSSSYKMYFVIQHATHKTFNEEELKIKED